MNSYFGTTGQSSMEEKAIENIDSLFDMPFGKIYVDKYFDTKVKTNVEEIIDNIVKEYKSRLENIDWLSDFTKENAINKFKKEIEYAKVNKSVDPDEFICSPLTVNAFYNPSDNSITIPAGYLQKPLYDENASIEANYGAIGVVIGHEISHAFDTTGSKYDCDGNMNNWWAEEDYNKFKEKTQKVSEFYSSLKNDNGNYINGSLTLGENIADISGMACVIGIINKMDNPNYIEFFESYGKMYREKLIPEYEEYSLNSDTHSPGKIRVNAVLEQFEEFYKAYGVTNKDKMYIKPEERLNI